MEILATGTFFFGEFGINAEKRRFTKSGKTINLNPKAFDLLLILVENHGKILSKNELLDTVWADQFVEENNLTVHISALRKIFGEKKGENRFIVTIPGRGYTFVADVRRIGEEERKRENETEAIGSGGWQLTKDKEQNQSSLIGRAREISELKSLLLRDDINLVTLTGAGGTGKTRLAQTISEEFSAEFSDGVFFTDLAAITGAELVAPAIAQTFDLKESGEKSPIETLKNFLRQRRLLLVLDNFEQLLSAAPLVKEITEAALHSKILVTSRIALGLKNEKEFVVAPLALPPPGFSFSIDDLAEYPAISLFIVRARAVKPNFNLTDETALAIAGICQKLDGLPLAIELAAPRVKLLSPQSILSRLENSLKLLTGGARDLPARQKTMRATVEWSYDLLDANEKILFRRLAVFAGGFTVDAAEAVVEDYAETQRREEEEAETESHRGSETTRQEDAEKKIKAGNPEVETQEAEVFKSQRLTVAAPLPFDVPASQTNVLDGVTSLLDKNLLEAKEQSDGDARLRMLEIVREFALEKLQAHDEAEILRQNHARYFLALAEEAEPHLLGEKSVEWLEKLEIEHDNLRAALRRSLEKDPETAMRIAAALRYFWSNHSHLTEGRRWLEEALKQSENAPSIRYLKLLNGLGQFARYQSDFETARKVYEKAVTAGKAANELAQIGIAYHGLAALATQKGNFEEAQKFNEVELAIYREINDKSGIAFALASLGDLALARGEASSARPVIEESLKISRELGNKQIASINLVNLGMVAFSEKDYDTAFSHFTESLLLAQELGNKAVISCSLDGFAALAEWHGDAEQAAKLAGAADRLRESIDFDKEPSERLFCEAYISKTRARLGEQTFIAEFEKGRKMGWCEAAALAVRKSEIFFGQTEIIIESHKFERVIIEEEIENVND